MCMHPQYALHRQDVWTLAINTLAQLPLKARGDRVQVQDLLEVLVFAASSKLSINPAGDDLEGAPSGATVLGELARQLADLDRLEATLHLMVARLVPKSLGKRGRRVAMDLIELPYQGTVDAAYQGEVCRGQAKQGTPHVFTDATAYAVVRGRR